jgi:hypothetical protein
MRSCRLALPLVAALLAGTGAASAATFQYSSYSVTNEQNITILTPNSISGGMGQIALIGTGPNIGQVLLAWCLDVYTYLQHSGTYNIGLLGTGGSGGSNPTLTTGQINEISWLMTNGNANINTSNESAATQLAIWKVEYGSSLTYSGVSTATTNLANTLLSEYVGCSNCGVTLLSESGDQTLGTPTVVPLPAALPLFATGLGALSLLGWRRKQKAAAAT